MRKDYEHCGNCALRETCKKATHIENYHMDNGCMDFISEEEYVDKRIPSEYFHGDFRISENEICVINYDDTDGEVAQDNYDPYTGKYAFVSPDDDVSDEEYETAAQEAHDELVRSLIEAGGEIRELNDEKRRLIFTLNEAVGWLNYFLTHNRADIYYDEANETRCRAEYLLMELEDAE